MRILGLDTATRRESVGIIADGEIVAEQSTTAGGSHAVSLLPLIDAVLRRAGCAVGALDGIAVSSGPGSFTGLRVGLSVAKGLARATGARLIGVSTLEALARTVTDSCDPVCALLDARKGEVYAACFEAAALEWRRLTEDYVGSVEALLPTLPMRCVVVGDAVPTYGAFLQSRLGSRVTLLPFEAHGPRGATVAALGWERWQTGGMDEPRDLEPRYLRASEAERRTSITR